MKSIKELRTVLRFHPQEINSSIAYFARSCDIDYDVYLPSKKMNLQRDFVWDLDQKRELIWSVLMNRYIPRMAMINNSRQVYEIIDGKQRLSTMIGFYKGDFSLLIDNKIYFFNELPTDYQRVISGFMFPYYVVNEDFGNQFTDEDKISWFRYINFAGTKQDERHLNKLK